MATAVRWTFGSTSSNKALFVFGLESKSSVYSTTFYISVPSGKRFLNRKCSLNCCLTAVVWQMILSCVLMADLFGFPVLHVWFPLVPHYKICVQQSSPYYILSSIQAYSDSLYVHSLGLQVVQLGNSSINWWKTLVGICRSFRYSGITRW